MTVKSSIYYIFIFIKNFSFLLLTLPLQTIVIIEGRSKTDLIVILTDIALVTFIITCACIYRKHITLQINNTSLTVRKGVFHKSQLSIPLKHRHSICITQNPIQKLLHAHKLTFSTSKTAVIVYISSRSLSLLPKSLLWTAKSTCTVKTKFTDILLLSANFHSSLTGVLTLAPFVKSLSSATAEDLFYSANIWEAVGYKKLPPLLATLSTLLLLVWFTGFIFTFFRFFSLKIYKKGYTLEISSGLISKQRYLLHSSNIGAVIFRQRLLMLLLKKITIELLLSNKSVRNNLTAGCIAKENKGFSYSGIRPPHNAVWSYSCTPLLCLLILSLCVIITDACSPYKIEPHLGAFLTLWCIVWYLIRITAFHRSHIETNSEILKMSTFSALSLITVFIPTKNIIKTRVTQNIFQQRKGTCNLKVFIRHPKRKNFSIRHISIKKAAELSHKLCG